MEQIINANQEAILCPETTSPKNSHVNQIERFLSQTLKMAGSALSKLLKVGSYLIAMCKRYLVVPVLVRYQPQIQRIKQKGAEMITAMDKGIEAAQVVVPPKGTYEGIDLKVLPKWICFKAAILKEKLTLQYIIAIHISCFLAYFVLSRMEVVSLHKQLREKEYILAPGVMDFTTAAPQSVSDSYVSNAAMSFLQMIGNVNSVNIDEQLKRLSEFMSPELRIQFQEESRDWSDTVKQENLSEILKVTDKEIISNQNGFYKVTALTKRERYADGRSLGSMDEVVEMVLQLIAPVKGKEWFLQINEIKRTKSDSLRGKPNAFESTKSN